ncbi:hypothetical protein CHL67_05345 [Prosthecochloris sp. GSB1]|uniref:intermembrane phospholipid transport protein YdbH family protein n=1 Tax=Prosthecochloris sp. GSB1 TaxID=281093 RepID=UPI000B8CF121|nr:YdbH domain-containing protein [Prosthecochloris sp. GSB1]ASQ90423.1 hypothetical protein CHL67_05345 [Prosthecochloris sp. GSB1]
MKWIARLVIAALLLLVVAAAAAWYALPRHAGSLIEGALENRGISVRTMGTVVHGFSGMEFDRLEIVFETPPDSCTGTTSGYSAIVHGAKLSWRLAHPDETTGRGKPFSLIPLSLSLSADSLRIEQQPSGMVFSDSEPLLNAGLTLVRETGLTFGFRPLHLDYSVENATVTNGALRLEDLSYAVSARSSDNWEQPPSLLHIASLSSGNEKLPLRNFRAMFGLRKNPETPCTLILEDCSAALFGLEATTPEIRYDLEKKETAFTLDIPNVPLATLPGFRGSPAERPAAKGAISGSIPVEFRDSTLTVRDARIRAEKGTKLLYYGLDGKPWLSIDASPEKQGADLMTDLNATVTLESRDEKLSGIVLKNFSSSCLGGTIGSAPATFAPSEKERRLILNMQNVGLPDRLRLHGDFSGSFGGSLSGTVPLTLKENGLVVEGARLGSNGVGMVVHSPPRRKENAAERFRGDGQGDATYTYTAPDLVVSRTAAGKTTIDFTLKSLGRKTTGGELLLDKPGGRLLLWSDRDNPSLVSLKNFSAGFLGGSIGMEHVDYDMKNKSAETVLTLNALPLQTLLDLQGLKKILATGTVMGRIPLKMKGGAFEISSGRMGAEDTGKIIYSTTPEELEAANQSLRLTYEALSDFSYSELLSSVSMTPEGESVISLQLKGINPSFQDGRPVHLNLKVEQNLLDLLRSLTISASIEQAISEKAGKQSK